MFYLSFITPTPPDNCRPGDGCLGVCVVDGDTMVAALAEATRLGINPGGEAMGLHIPVRSADELPEDGRSYYQRLVPVSELRANGARTLGQLEDADPDFAEAIKGNAEHVCACCNGRLH